MKDQFYFLGMFLWGGLILTVLYIIFLFARWVCTVQMYVFWLKKDGQTYVHVRKDDRRFVYFTRVLSYLSSDLPNTANTTPMIIDLGTPNFCPTNLDKAVNLTKDGLVPAYQGWLGPLFEVIAIQVQPNHKVYDAGTATAHIGTNLYNNEREPVEVTFIPLDWLCKGVDQTDEVAVATDLLTKYLEKTSVS